MMKMNFIVLSKLLSASLSLLIVGYGFLFFNLFLFINGHSISLVYFLFCIVIILIGLMHHYIAVRVHFDAKLLELLYHEMKHQPIEQLTNQLDHSLISFKLMPKNKASRNWNLRFQGCRNLFKLQISFLMIQVCLFIFSLLYLYNE